MYSSIPSAFLITELLRLHDVKEVVISPGSRSAPLTIGFSENVAFNCHSIVDERSAAFYALGLAQAKNESVVLVCTSGSALLNYFPAVAEAFYSDIPLLVLSADRPEHLLEIGDGQTILQAGVYGKMVAHSTKLLLDNPENQSIINETNQSRIEEALFQLKFTHRPVHINIPFEEPLYNKTENPLFEILPVDFPSKGLQVKSQKINIPQIDSPLKVMCLVGTLNPCSQEIELLKVLNTQFPVLMLHESLSQLSLPNAIDSIDTLIAPLERRDETIDKLKRLQPDLLITAGGMIVSKKIKALLRTNNNLIHVHLEGKTARDTYFAFQGSLNFSELKTLLDSINIDTSYKEYWIDYYKSLDARIVDYVKNAPYSDFKVYSLLFKIIPEDYIIHVANSSAIRYAQLFPNQNYQYCNRGTSGIEGSVSTSVGFAKGTNSAVVLITGDLSFLYDSNALWTKDLPANFRIIVVNNSGGGIFRILPGKEKSSYFSKYFETVHDYTSKQIAKQFDFEYKSVNKLSELENILDSFFDRSSKPQILEVMTNPQVNEAILLNYFKALQ